MNCGTILHDRDFQFSNTGQTANKLSILVCTEGECHFALVVTTTPDRKGQNAGCQSKDKQPNYFLPKGSCWFDEDTWVLLDELPEISDMILQSKLSAGSAYWVNTPIPNALMKDILECAKLSPLLDGFDQDFVDRGYKQL